MSKSKQLEVTQRSAREGRPINAAAERRARWSSQDMVDALSFAAIHFEPFVPAINALNVFPVPDGDTGTNMFLTLQAAATAARQSTIADGKTVGDVLRGAARGALMGARGNSGVILYQMIEGLAQSAPGTAEIDGAGLVVGLRRAAELAYQAVINPVEGTMLTVIRMAAESAEQAATKSPTTEYVLEVALNNARDALRQTPEMLPVLKQAGVIDAGGKGVVVILDGLLRFATGREPAQPTAEQSDDIASVMTFLDQVELVHGVDEFGYCTNFLLTGTQLEVDRFREKMNELGTSAVVVGSDEAIKVHVHSEHPGRLLEAALEYGELEDVRIDNMAAQTRRLLADRSLHEHAVREQIEPVSIAIVAVASGAGLAKALLGMGSNFIVDGGPTTNPSTEEILKGVERAPSDVVIILPNDPNVIASANQVAKLTDKTVRVVPSKTIPQGISALSSFNLSKPLDENVASMSQALDFVTTVSIARASRDAHIDGVRARQGEYIGLVNGAMVAAGGDLIHVALEALEKIDVDSAELLTVFTGELAEQEQIAELSQRITEQYANVTVEIADGGQPHYDVILAIE